jgi:hypothetical protein
MRTRHPRKKAAATTWCRAAADVLTFKTEGGGSGGGSKLSWDQSKWLAVVLAFLLASLTRGLLTLYSVIGQNALFLLPILACMPQPAYLWLSFCFLSWDRQNLYFLCLKLS